jgi:hypothetical protein
VQSVNRRETVLAGDGRQSRRNKNGGSGKDGGGERCDAVHPIENGQLIDSTQNVWFVLYVPSWAAGHVGLAGQWPWPPGCVHACPS